MIAQSVQWRAGWAGLTYRREGDLPLHRVFDGDGVGSLAAAPLSEIGPRDSVGNGQDASCRPVITKQLAFVPNTELLSNTGESVVSRMAKRGGWEGIPYVVCSVGTVFLLLGGRSEGSSPAG